MFSYRIETKPNKTKKICSQHEIMFEVERYVKRARAATNQTLPIVCSMFNGFEFPYGNVDSEKPSYRTV